MLMVNKIQPFILALLSAFLLIPTAQAGEPAAAEPAASFGAIVGIVSDAAKRPVGGVTVTAVRAGGGIRAAISGSDGVYSFADLPVGSWSLSAAVEGARNLWGRL